MTTATTNIVITAKDATSAAFASANSNLASLASNSIKVTTALSALGAGAFVGTMAAFTKQTIDAQDELFKLSQKTGIAVESLAGLEFAAEQSGVELDKVAKATRAFSLLVVEAADESSEASKKLAQLGLTYKDLKDQSPEKQLLTLADALSKFSKEDRPVALVSTLGQKMSDLIPLLSGGSQGLQQLIDQGKKLNPVTEESARNSEKFNDQINLLNKSVSTLGREMVQDLIPSLTRISDEMVKAAEKGGILAGALAGVKQLFTESFGNPKILGDVGQIRREILKTQETIAQMSGKKDSIFFDKNALAHEQEKLQQLEIELQGAIAKSREVITAQDATTASVKKFAVAIDDVTPKVAKQKSSQDSLNKAQQESLRIESDYIKLLGIERKAREDLLRPYEQSAKSAQDRLDSMQQEVIAMDLSRTKQVSLEQAIELTTIARLEEKKAITQDAGAVAEIDKEIAARRQIIGVIQNTEEQTKKLAQANRSTADEVSQLWMQAGRNIQSTLANSIFNFFDDGLKGMLKNVVSTVGRIASEFAALKLAQNIGLTQMFGGVGGTGGAVSGGSSLLSAASLASAGSSLFRTGFGATSALSGIGGMLPGSAGAFFGGMGGGTIAGVSSPAAMMGSSFAAAAGPLMAAYLGTQLLKGFAGENRLGGGFGKALNAVGDIPILGDFLPIVPLINGLFGREPYKFRQQSIQGTATSAGFDGDITNVFRSRGAVFSGNKHKNVTDQFSDEQQALFDSTLSGFYGSAHKFAENLGLSTDLVDNFRKEIQIVSEKNKTVTSEAIADMLSGIGNDIAKNVLPIIDTFKKAGEDSFGTLTRLNAEFVALNQGARNLGASAAYAKELVSGMSIEARTAFVDAIGGTDKILQGTGFIFENFLTGTQQLAAHTDQLSTDLKALGLSADLTKEQYLQLVQSLDTPVEVLSGLLDSNFASRFLTVRNAQNEAAEAAKRLADATENLSEKSRVLANERNEFTAARREAQSGNNTLPTVATTINGKIFTEAQIRADQQSEIDRQKAAVQSIFSEQLSRLTERFNQTVSGIQKSIDEIANSSAFFAGLKDTFLSMQGTSRQAALAQVDAAIQLAGAGADIKSIDTPEFANAVSKLKDTTEDFFSSRRDFELSKSESASKIKELSNLGLTKADETLDILKSQLDVQQRTFSLQEQQIKSVLTLSGGGVDLLDNATIAGQGDSALTKLISAMATQMGTTFNGSVRFPDPMQFNRLQSGIKSGLAGTKTNLEINLNPLLDAIKSLKDEISAVKSASMDTAKLLDSVTRGGRAMNTVNA